MLNRILGGVLGKRPTGVDRESGTGELFEIVMSVPHEHRNDFIPRLPHLRLT